MLLHFLVKKPFRKTITNDFGEALQNLLNLVISLRVQKMIEPPDLSGPRSNISKITYDPKMEILRQTQDDRSGFAKPSSR